MTTIKTWHERLNVIAGEKIITSRDVTEVMQDEIDELRAALNMSTASTHQQNVSKNEPKIDTSQAEQNRMRSEALSSKTVRWESPPDWAAS